MAKRFDIQEWIAKQRLAEQDDFTPDLEDDDLKRSKIQQMMAKEKESEYELSDQEKDNLHDMVIEFARKLTDVRGGNYSGDKLLAALQYVTLEIENLEPMIYDDEDGDGIPDELENDEELDEQNVTGTGASMQAGEGMGHFGKRKKRNYMNEEEQEETDQLSSDKLGKDGEIEPDVSYVQNMLTSKINTSEEWMELFYTLIDHSQDIKGLNSSTIKSLLQQSIREI